MAKIPANGFNAPVELDAAETKKLVEFISASFPDEQSEITGVALAEAGGSHPRHFVVTYASGQKYSLRPAGDMGHMVLATEVLEACHVPNVSPVRKCGPFPIFPPLAGKVVVFRRLPGDPRNLENRAVQDEIKEERLAYLRDLGAWACVGPVLGFSDVHYGNFVWDRVGKRFARVDFQAAFATPGDIQGMLTLCIQEKLLTKTQLAEGTEEGAKAFRKSFELVHDSIGASLGAWLPMVRSECGQGTAEAIEQWAGRSLADKLTVVGAYLPQ